MFSSRSRLQQTRLRTQTCRHRQEAGPIPAGVTATLSGQKVTMKGPKGELSFTCPDQIGVEQSANGIAVSMREDSQSARALWGMSRTQIVNLIEGVTNGYSQTLEIHGVGFRAAMKGKDGLQV